jgi:hypothetical protein
MGVAQLTNEEISAELLDQFAFLNEDAAGQLVAAGKVRWASFACVCV